MNASRRSFVLAATAWSLAPRWARASLPPAEYTNPVYARDFPDPFVIEHDGVYHAYATQSGGPRFQHGVSRDLVHWTVKSLDFPDPFSTEHLWAPEVARIGERFVLTYSALDPATKRHHIAVATADHPTGRFSHQKILVRGDENKVGVIDTHVAFEDGRPYLLYSEETPRRIVARPLREDGLEVTGDPVELVRPDQPWEHGVNEAPTVVRRGNKVILIYSGSGYQNPKNRPQYAVGFATADRLLGPYTKHPEPILQTAPDQVYGPGHQCVVQTKNGDWWMLYHGWNSEGEPMYGRNPHGRTLRLDRLIWDLDRPRALGPTTTPQAAPVIG
jgi:beta-xylosidase